MGKLNDEDKIEKKAEASKKEQTNEEKLKNVGKQLMRQCYQVVDGMMR